MIRVVLDTNCLLASISSRSEYFIVWRGLHEGKYTLCVSNEILAEYEEIIAVKANPTVAKHVVDALVDSDYVEFVDPQFKLRLITTTSLWIALSLPMPVSLSLMTIILTSCHQWPFLKYLY